MQLKVLPKAPIPQHWYILARRLADQCRMASWTQHFSIERKVTYGAANYAMHERKSLGLTETKAAHGHALFKRVEESMKGDMKQWLGRKYRRYRLFA